jgi:hypothetical protein
MKMRLTPSNAAPGAWLTAGRLAAGAVLVGVTVSACTGGPSSSSPVFTPTPQTSGQGSSASQPGTRTPSPAGGASRSAGGSASTRTPAHGSSSAASSSARASDSATSRATQAAATHTQSPTPASTPPTPASTPSSAVTAFPSAAPETGGGGTAGLQDGLLFGVGGLAVFAGLGTLAYRRRLSRKFGADDPAPRDPAPRDPANH